MSRRKGAGLVVTARSSVGGVPTPGGRVRIPPAPYGRTVLAKTCDACGELKQRRDFYGSKPSGDRTCTSCKSAAKRAEATRLREAGQSRPKVFHAGIILVAATCASCGELLAADRFRIAGGVPETAACYSCRWQQESRNPVRDVRNMRRHRERRQSETRPKARRSGQPWNGAELEIVLREDLTAREAAAMLGRTFVAVNSARQRARQDPQWIALAGMSRAG